MALSDSTPHDAEGESGMDISFSCQSESVSILADASTQCSTPTLVNASTQTGSECDNSMRRHLIMETVTKNNKNCLFWTGISTLTLLNYLFE